jgi:hypothetical protein
MQRVGAIPLSEKSFNRRLLDSSWVTGYPETITRLIPLNAVPEIRQILADGVGAENNGIGIVVGVVDANGRRIAS